MKRLLVLSLACTCLLSCTRSSDHPASAKNAKLSPKESAVASIQDGKGELTAISPMPLPDAGSPDAAIVYPEKSDVLAILYRARELRQQWQFDSALMLVSQALALDPSSPMAQSMEREIAEVLKRLRVPETQQRTKMLRYAA